MCAWIRRESRRVGASLLPMHHFSLTGKRWILERPDPVLPSSDFVRELAGTRGIDPSTDGLTKLSDPLLFPDMEKAVTRIERAVSSGETIGIFGDYDADGITGVAQILYALRRRGVEPVVYLPDRAKEGFGLKIATIDTLQKKGVTLLITVDTGIASATEVAYATTCGIDTIITDHHRPHGKIPASLAIIHPLVPAPFPNPHLCGSGVALMLVRALEHGKRWDGIERDLVLATIGTIGDVVPLTGENRILVLSGLKQIASLPPSPLKDFFDAVCPRGGVTSTDIAFRIVPRINAAGRMAHPEIALDALMSGGISLDRLHALNAERQTFVEELMESAQSQLDPSHDFLSVFSEAFTSGTVGLIAGKLTEMHGKPSIVGAIQDEKVVCSLRSVEGADVSECLAHTTVAPHLSSFGGHAQAAGCTFAISQMEAVRSGLQEALQAQCGEREFLPAIRLDAELAQGFFTTSFAKSLLALEPFGAQNSEPTFFLRKKKLLDLRAIGDEGAHISCRIDGVKAVGFRFGSYLDTLSLMSFVDLACRVSINAWNGREDVQLIIEDIRESKL